MSIKKIYVDSSAKPVAVTGLYFKVMQATAEVTVEFMLANGESYETGLSTGQGVKFDSKYTSVRLSSDSAQQIMIWAGVGQLTQDSQNTTSLAGSSYLDTNVVALSAAVAAQVVPVTIGRRSVLIAADSPFYVGASDVDTASGFPVDGEITIETQGEVWAISDTAQELRILEEFN